MLPKNKGVVNVQGSTLDIYEYEMIMQAIDQIYSCDDIPQLIQLIAITKSRIEKIGNTSYTCKFEAYKVITMPDDFKIKSQFLDAVSGEPKMLGLPWSSALVCDPPVLCGYATGTLIIPKNCQRGPQDPRFKR